MKRITIQGIAGCFHETAAHGSFPGEEVEVLPCVSFDEQFARMAADAELLGVAAIENTIAGSLLPNHELLRRSTLAVIGEYKLRISHVLAALPGQQIADIREVHSHPIALMQCGEYLKARPAMKVVERDDTAGSAREIAGQRLAGLIGDTAHDGMFPLQSGFGSRCRGGRGGCRQGDHLILDFIRDARACEDRGKHFVERRAVQCDIHIGHRTLPERRFIGKDHARLPGKSRDDLAQRGTAERQLQVVALCGESGTGIRRSERRKREAGA